MKRILINATQKEELRVAIIDGQKLIDLDIETPSSQRKKGNVYKGSITRVEPGLDAVFVDYGDPKHGFLPFREVAQAYYKNKTGGRNDVESIGKALNQGQALLVQVQREGRGGKGAALTTFISLAGRYTVLMPNNPRSGGGVSRRMDEKKRDKTREILAQLDVRDGESVIIRTKGAGREPKLLQQDLDRIRNLWDSIIAAAKGRPAPFLVYEESNIVICALRDHFSDDTEEIIIDNEEVFEDARKFINLVMPQHLDKLKLYQEPVPLFNRYHIESEIETAFEREITLPSGGSIVFDNTEALLSIDINSGRATKGKNIEETALNTNLEAAEEIARQLRLRDLGGLIVIDFIDMVSAGNRRAVENRLYQTTSQDQARVQFERISRFGLLEMSRQRMRPSLSESSHLACPRCNGKGFIRTLESSALSTLRMVEEEAMKEKSSGVVAQLPTEVTTFLLNEKREQINEIEKRHNVTLMIVPDIHMQIPHFKIQRYRISDEENRGKHSYEMIPKRKPSLPHAQSVPNPQRKNDVPAVNLFVDSKAPPGLRAKNLVRRFFSLFTGSKPVKEEQASQSPESRRRRRGRRSQGAQRSERADASRRPDDRARSGNERGKQQADAERNGDPSQQRTERSRRRRRSQRSSAPATHADQVQDAPPDRSPDRNHGRGGNRPSPQDKTAERTASAPPMPTLPPVPPPDDVVRDVIKGATEKSPQPEAPAAQPDAAADKPQPEQKFEQRPGQSPGQSPGQVSEQASGQSLEQKPEQRHETSDAATKQNQPSPYVPPRFSKPANLTQVETKPATGKPPATDSAPTRPDAPVSSGSESSAAQPPGGTAPMNQTPVTGNPPANPPEAGAPQAPGPKQVPRQVP